MKSQRKEKDGQKKVKGKKRANDLENNLLEMAPSRGIVHELGGLAKRTPGTRSAHKTVPLSPANERARPESVFRILLDREGLPCQGGLVDQEVAGNKVHVGRDKVPGSDVDKISRDQTFGIDFLPDAVALDPGADLKTAPEKRQSFLSLLLLGECQKGIHEEQNNDDPRLKPFPKNIFQEESGFQHPGDRPPKLK